MKKLTVFLKPDGKALISVFDDVNIIRRTMIVARFPGHFTRNLGREIRGGTTKTLDLQLLPTRKIRGRIFRDGKPLRNARIKLVGVDIHPILHSFEQGLSDDKGQFEIDNVPTGFRYQLLVKQNESTDAGWATPPLSVVHGDSDDTHLIYWPEGRQTDFSFQQLQLLLSGDPLPADEALQKAATRQLELQYNGLATTNRVTASDASLEIKNPKRRGVSHGK